MFFSVDIKLPCFTTNKNLLSEMPVWITLFYLQKETIQSRSFASHSEVILLSKLTGLSRSSSKGLEVARDFSGQRTKLCLKGL